MIIKYKTIGWILLFMAAVIVAVESLKIPMSFMDGALIFVLASIGIGYGYHRVEINGEIQIPPSKE